MRCSVLRTLRRRSRTQLSLCRSPFHPYGCTYNHTRCIHRLATHDFLLRLQPHHNNYISSHELTRGKVLAAYKYSEEDDDIQQIRCKSLAAIGNFFKVNKNGDSYNLSVTNATKLKDFFSDKNAYSVEHFIIATCGNLHVKTEKYDFSYRYPSQIQKYKNSLFNYIFIPQTLNDSLSNTDLFSKIKQLNENINQISCMYSQEYYSLLAKNPRMFFQNYPSVKRIDSYETEDDVRAYLDDYFSKTFPDEFLQFSMALVKKINWGS